MPCGDAASGSGSSGAAYGVCADMLDDAARIFHSITSHTISVTPVLVTLLSGLIADQAMQAGGTLENSPDLSRRGRDS